MALFCRGPRRRRRRGAGERRDAGVRDAAWAAGYPGCGQPVRRGLDDVRGGWIRLLTLVLGSSTYSFTIMLATFILGLSLGGLMLSLRRKPTGYALTSG